MRSDDESPTTARVGAAATAALVLVWSSTAGAQKGAAGAETTIPGGTLVIVGYMVLWVMLGGYLLFVMWRQRRLTDDIEQLRERIDQAYGVSEKTGDGEP